LDTYTVYRHVSPDGKVYIGTTSLKPNYRWNYGKGYKRSTKFFKAINEIGWDNFKHEILFENLSQFEAEKIEKELIKKYNSTDDKYGYNMAEGSTLIGYKRTEETKQRIGAAQKGKIINPNSIEKRRETVLKNKTYVGKNNPMYGKHHSKLSREKMSISQKLVEHKPLTKEHKLNLSKALMASTKTKCKKVVCIETGEVYKSIGATARAFKVTPQAIWASCKGKPCGPIKGYNFKYFEEG
jgi:group I intron endonuclease